MNRTTEPASVVKDKFVFWPLLLVVGLLFVAIFFGTYPEYGDHARAAQSGAILSELVLFLIGLFCSVAAVYLASFERTWRLAAGGPPDCSGTERRASPSTRGTHVEGCLQFYPIPPFVANRSAPADSAHRLPAELSDVLDGGRTMKSAPTEPCIVTLMGREWLRHRDNYESEGKFKQEILDSPRWRHLFEKKTRLDDEAGEAMSAIRLVASHITPTSEEGWAFQVMSAGIYMGTMTDAHECGEDRGFEEDRAALARILDMLSDRYALLQAAA
jgi:hypothetical protein